MTVTGDPPAAVERPGGGPAAGAGTRPVAIDGTAGPAPGRRPLGPILIALTTLLAVSAVVAVGLGPVAVAPDRVWSVIGHHLIGRPATGVWSDAEATIVWEVRLPRVLLACAIGALLALAGAALQALVRNALAEPYLLGVSSGASVGAAAVIAAGSLAGRDLGTGTGPLTVAAFIGGLGATAGVFALARTSGVVTPMRLILAGVSASYVLSSTTSMLVLLSDRRDGARGVLFWLLGSLDGARWSVLALPVAATVLAAVVLLGWSDRLDAVALGDETALSLGVDPGRLRMTVFTLVAICVAAAVAVAGPIGFIGLIVPHVARLIAGGLHRRMLPVAFLLGAVVLVWADVAARVALAPREIPIGVVTTVVGAPLLLLLVRRAPHGAD